MPPDPAFTIRDYEPADEQGWLRCRVLAFLDTAYFDDVYREKERYGSRAVELVAEAGGQIVGLIDVECEDGAGSICSKTAEFEPPRPAGMIWHLAVHPDTRRRGIGRGLLATASEQTKEWGIARFEAWTRDDPFVNEWYEAMGFRWVQSYHHVYMTTRDEVAGSLRTEVPALRPVKVLAHYVGAEEELLARFQRVHRCNRYDLYL